jgi:hypothetical protein
MVPEAAARLTTRPLAGRSFLHRPHQAAAMKILAALAILPLLALAACGNARPASNHAESRAANQNAANQAEKSFDKEVPADPAAMRAEPAK